MNPTEGSGKDGADVPVVNNTQHLRAFKSLRRSEGRSKKICSTTPVICVIMYLTVSSVKLLNNVVCGIGKAMQLDLPKALKDQQEFVAGNRKAVSERRICDNCGNASKHYVVYESGLATLKRCEHCGDIFAHNSISRTLTGAALQAFTN